MKTESIPGTAGEMIRVCGHDSQDSLVFCVGDESWLVSNGQVWRPRLAAALPRGIGVIETTAPASPAWLAAKAAALAGIALFLIVGVAASL